MIKKHFQQKLNQIAQKSQFLQALIYSYISHAEFFLVNNVLIEYDRVKEEIKNPKGKQICLM